MVPGYDEDRHTSLGDFEKGPKRLKHEGRMNPGSVEDVATVDHQIYPTVPRHLQRLLVVGQEVVTSPTTVDSRPCGQVVSPLRTASAAA